MILVIKECECGIKFNPETTGQDKCAICFQNLITRVGIKRPKYQTQNLPTGLDTSDYKQYQKLYSLLPRRKERKKLWTREARDKQRKEFGHILW